MAPREPKTRQQPLQPPRRSQKQQQPMTKGSRRKMGRIMSRRRNKTKIYTEETFHELHDDKVDENNNEGDIDVVNVTIVEEEVDPCSAFDKQMLLKGNNYIESNDKINKQFVNNDSDQLKQLQTRHTSEGFKCASPKLQLVKIEASDVAKDYHYSKYQDEKGDKSISEESNINHASEPPWSNLESPHRSSQKSKRRKHKNSFRENSLWTERESSHEKAEEEPSRISIPSFTPTFSSMSHTHEPRGGGIRERRRSDISYINAFPAKRTGRQRATSLKSYENMSIPQLQRRLIANARERSRVHALSNAFLCLRRAIPSYSPKQKLSKLTILRVAIHYINALEALLECDGSVRNANLFIEGVEDCTSVLRTEYGRSRSKSAE